MSTPASFHSAVPAPRYYLLVYRDRTFPYLFCIAIYNSTGIGPVLRKGAEKIEFTQVWYRISVSTKTF